MASAFDGSDTLSQMASASSPRLSTWVRYDDLLLSPLLAKPATSLSLSSFPTELMVM
jgi:hypothetical protein